MGSKKIHKKRFWFYIMGLYESMEIIPDLDIKQQGPIHADINIKDCHPTPRFNIMIMEMYVENE